MVVVVKFHAVQMCLCVAGIVLVVVSATAAVVAVAALCAET